MFDPSKLNLDLDNLDNDNQNSRQSTKKNNTTNQNNQKEEKIEKQTPKNDILEEINIEQKTTKENTMEKTLENIETKKEINFSKEKEENNLDTEINIQKENNKIEIKEEKIKNSTQKEENNKKEPEKKEEKKIIFDINLNSAQALMSYLIKKEYDFFIIEPEEDKVKITFFKNKVIKEIKYIKYPIYLQILVKLKSISNLKIDTTDKSQEGNGNIHLYGKVYNVFGKTSPTNIGEKIFIKLKLNDTKKVKKEVNKISIGKIFGFLGAIIFIALVLGGTFISFIVMHAKTVEDVKFFYRLGINLNDINNFIETAVTIIFSIIVLFEIITLIIFLFKFLFTKKEFKTKRIFRGIISLILLIITFSTVSVWMLLDKKIRALPNWQELAYGNIQVLDNDLYNKPHIFNKQAALLTKTTNLIGPINIMFDLTNFTKNEQKKGLKINKYKWVINGKKEIITLEPILINKFNKVGTYKIDLFIEETDIHGDTLEKKVENIPSIEVSHIVKIEEEKLDDGGKIVKFDASDLKDLGKIDWYFITDINDTNLKPVFTGYKFYPTKVLLEDTIIGLKIKKPNDNNDNLDKIFVIEATKEDIKAKINITQDPINDLLYTFKVTDINLDFGNGFIEKFKWKIDDKITKNLNADVNNLEKSSTIKNIFHKYGKHKITVELIDSNGNKKILEKEFEIKKRIKLKNSLEFFNDNKKLKVEYQKDTNEYFLKNIKAPTTIEISAKNIESDNILDYLEKVEWDIGGDGDIDEAGKILNYPIPKRGTFKIDVYYTFQNKRIRTKKTKLKETIYIDSEKKEAILSLKIYKPKDYVPVKVSFDASNSYVKGKDISKFIFDYGDGTPLDLRDALNKGHLYTKPGDYIVRLIVVTTDGKKYSIEKKLVLKPEPQKAEITASMKKAPIYTPIDFSSSKSSGEIIGYFWDFGDGTTSTEANPSHMYKKPGEYTVKLTLDYKNKNTLTDKLNIQITDE